MLYISATRRSKFGFGYNTNVEQGWNNQQTESYLRVKETKYPDFVGTISSVYKQIEESRDFQSLGSTYFTTAWFIKKDGIWFKIKNTFENNTKTEQLINRDCDAVFLEVERMEK